MNGKLERADLFGLPNQSVIPNISLDGLEKSHEVPQSGYLIPG
jgi:hypothetical protein